MTGWTFFFMLLGVGSATAQLFRWINWVERPARRNR